MPRDRQLLPECPKCAGSNFNCTYNHFERDELRIDSWEHRCQDCGHRETSAVRSDDQPDEDAEPVAPEVCPFCGRRGIVS